MPRSTINLRHLLTLVAITCVIPASAVYAGGGKGNIEEGLPVTVEDTYPAEYLGREFQLITRYQSDGGDDVFTFVPRLELGVWWNTELTIEAPFVFGDPGEDDGAEYVSVEGLYNFNQETLDLPAFSLAAGADVPIGGSEGVNPFVELIATKTLGRTMQLHQLHLNLEYQYNAIAENDEREHLYTAVIGYSTRLNTDTTFVADFVRETTRTNDEEINLIEAGIRYQLTPQTILAAGAGFGIGDESPDFRLTLGLQLAF